MAIPGKLTPTASVGISALRARTPVGGTSAAPSQRTRGGALGAAIAGTAMIATKRISTAPAPADRFPRGSVFRAEDGSTGRPPSEKMPKSDGRGVSVGDGTGSTRARSNHRNGVVGHLVPIDRDARRALPVRRSPFMSSNAPMPSFMVFSHRPRFPSRLQLEKHLHHGTDERVLPISRFRHQAETSRFPRMAKVNREAPRRRMNTSGSRDAGIPPRDCVVSPRPIHPENQESVENT